MINSQSPLQWLAAILSICAFLTAPITQQAISYISPSMPTENGTASAYRATAFSRSHGTAFIPCVTSLLPFSGNQFIANVIVAASSDAFSIENAVLSAAYLGPNSSLEAISPICSTAQCTWPDYSSIGICASLTNVSDFDNQALLKQYLTYVIQTHYDMYPGGDPVYAAFIVSWPSPSNLYNQSVTQAAVSQPWIAFSNELVSLTRTPDVSTFRFYAITFYFCIKTLHTAVTRGIPDVHELSSLLEISSPPVQFLNFEWNSTFFLNDTCGNELVSKSMKLAGPLNSTESYSVDMCTGLLFSNFFNLAITGAIFLHKDKTVAFVIGQISTALGLSLFGNFLNTTIFNPATQFDNVDSMMGNIAKSLTNL
jgi:hypothetical protein